MSEPAPISLRQRANVSATTVDSLPTWRVEPDFAATANSAVDHGTIPVAPGDHVVMKCWIRTGGQSPIPYAGARMAFDPYADHRITGCNSEEQAASGTNDEVGIDAAYVHWGSDWTQVVWDFTVPATYTSDGALYPSNGYPAGELVAPTGLIPWLQIWTWGPDASTQYPNGAYASWFSGFDLYVNPL